MGAAAGRPASLVRPSAAGIVCALVLASGLTPGIAGLNDDLYAVGKGIRDIFRIDPATGAGVSLYANYPNTTSFGVAQRPSDGMIFYIAGLAGNDRVYRFDPATPATAPVLLGTSGVAALPRLCFSASGVLYGSTFGTNPIQLYVINQTTGAAASPVDLSGETTGSGGDMAFGPDGQLYIVAARNVYLAPIGGGALTSLGVITGVAGNLPSTAFDRDGRLLVGNDENPAKLYSVDRTTLAATLIGPMPTTIDDLGSAPRVYLRGKVFEDVNYGGGAGRNRVTASGVGRPGARVELFDAAGSFLTSTVTDAAGDFALTGAATASYTVRVVSSSVTSSRPGAVAGLLPVQTFRTDASSGSALDVVVRVGGEQPSKSDAGNGSTTLAALTTATTTAQSVTTVTIAAADILGLDFGFNFDTVVNTNSTGQGSLRQFIVNANTLGNVGLAQAGKSPGVETSLFMVPSTADPFGRPTDPGFDGLRGVAVITPSPALPALGNADTAIDGTTQTTDIGNTRPGLLGTGGPVGVDGLALPQVEAPEVEIVGSPAVGVGLDLQANGAILRGLAVYGFGSASNNGNIRVGVDASSAWTGIVIEDNVIGARADAFTDPDLALPGSGTTGCNVVVSGADSGIVRDNLIGYAGRLGVTLTGSADDWIIERNEIRRNGLDSNRLDGISTTNGSSRTVMRQNLVANNQGAAVDFFQSLGDHTVENNTLEDNGWGGVEPIGVRMFGSDSTIDRNVIRNQIGAGVLAVVFDVAFPQTPAVRNRITSNRFSGNGSNAIDLQATLDVVAPGDGITLNDGTLLGDGSVPNVCGTVATHGNEGLDFPIVDRALVGTGGVTVRGRACPGSVVEIYRGIADGDGSDTLGGADYGEGVVYLVSAAAAAGTGEFEATGVSGLVSGDFVTAIAIDASGNTSEFSGNVPVETLKIVKRTFQGDGTPIADGSTLPSGMPVKFLIYIDNPIGIVSDVSLRDVLDTTFVYETGTLRVDNTLASVVSCPGGVCDEALIFSQVNGSGTALGDGDAVTAPIDADIGSYDAPTRTIEIGDQNDGDNDQLDLAADRVWALVFTIRMQ